MLRFSHSDNLGSAIRRQHVRRTATSIRLATTLFLILAASTSAPTLAFIPQDRPNILFIAVDDLRPDIGCYGSTQIQTPNIDRLAATGVRFTRAYCQQAICGPSRASLLTGLRPDSLGVHGNHQHFRKLHPDLVTLPQLFKQSGYDTRSFGKIWHGPFHEGASITTADTFDDPPSWSQPPFKPGPRYYYTEPGIAAARRVFHRIYRPIDPAPDDWTRKLVFGPATEAPPVDDAVLYDGQVARAATQALRDRAQSDLKSPFFLAVGFIKPHSPYIAPKRWFDRYDPSAIEPAARQDLPDGAPSFAGHNSGELRRYTDQPARGPFSLANQRRVKQAYQACTSYVDAQIGLLLDELDRLDLTKSTIVVLWSDHGYHLGEKGLWGKTTCYELDTRVVLVIKAPGRPGAGRASPALVELVDLYPTLSDLAGLNSPDNLEGTSLVPLLDQPDLDWKQAAYSQYTRGGRRGYARRDDRYRYVEWYEHRSGRLLARELYNHDEDPNETKNLADADASRSVVAELSRKLARGEGWRRERSKFASIQDTLDLELHPVFASGMVIQRDQPIRVFGRAKPSTSIRVRFAGQDRVTQTDPSGHWRVELAPQQASSTPTTMTIEARRKNQLQTRVLENLLIGEVWLCAGQSNMRWRVRDSVEADEVKTAHDPQLRLIDFEGRLYPSARSYPIDLLRDLAPDTYYTTQGWRPASPDSIPSFSAVSYFFGTALRRELDVPVGLIHNAIGGVPTESYIPVESLIADPMLRPLRSHWIESKLLPRWCRQRARRNLEAWFKSPRGLIPHHPFEPGFLSAAAIEPLAGFGLRGFLWYQGESNATVGGAASLPLAPAPERRKLELLISSWRKLWSDSSLPFYMVQLPGLNRDWEHYRELQLQVAQSTPNCDLAVTIDLGHPTDVHPRAKRAVAERLARLALTATYHRKDLLPGGPRPTAFDFRKNDVRVDFDRIGQALSTSDHQPIRGFVLAGQDQVFHPANARVENSKVIVSSPRVQSPVALRYGFEDDPNLNLVNSDSLPASPFRSDDWSLTSPPPVLPPNTESFEALPPGPILQATFPTFILQAAPGHASITDRFASHGHQSLHLQGGNNRSIHLTLTSPRSRPNQVLQFRAERWTKRPPFRFRIEAKLNRTWQQIHNGDRSTLVGARFLSQVNCPIPPAATELRLTSTSPLQSGILIDELRLD